MQFDIATSSRKSERHNVTKQQDNRTESFHRVDTPPYPVGSRRFYLIGFRRGDFLCYLAGSRHASPETGIAEQACPPPTKRMN